MPKTYDQAYQAKWEQSHPNQDYDTYINNLVDEHRLEPPVTGGFSDTN